jgi:hypothetical protein
VNGRYEIGLDHIRALAIECHALDVQFDVLFNGPTICGTTETTRRVHNRLLSTTLLSLAISVRVSLANEPKYSQIAAVQPSAIYEVGGEIHSCSIKDICDKLIHADRIYRPIEPGVRGGCCELSGRLRKQPWALGLSVQIFCEYMLRWLDELEQQNGDSRKSVVTT